MMWPLVTELGLAGLITATGSALAAVIAALVQGTKTRAEVAHMRRQVTTSMEATSRELTHDHGSTMKDAADRTETKVDELAAGLAAVTELVRGIGAEQDRQSTRLHAVERGLGGLRDDVRQNRVHGDEEHDSIRDDLRDLRRHPCIGWDAGDNLTTGKDD